MLTEDERGRVCVVLVRARNPSNIGAVARAMHDFGFSRLRVVNEFRPPLEAAKSAVDAVDVIANAVSCASVAEAVADCTLVVGTTAVGERALEHELLTLAEAAPRIRAELRNPTVDDKAVEPFGKLRAGYGAPAAGGGRVALLFGSEKTGLSNDELSHCNWLLTIPMQEYAEARHPSMNLGQAAAVCLYELVRNSTHPPQPAETARRGPRHDDTAVLHGELSGSVQPVPAALLERITELLSEVMERTGYTRRYAHNCSPDQVRRLVRRIGANALDAPVWTGILKQVLWKLGGSEGSAADPSAALRDDKQ